MVAEVLGQPVTPIGAIMDARQKIRRFAEETSQTQEELSRSTGIAQSAISEILNGQRGLTFPKAIKILQAMRRFHPGATLDWLVDPQNRTWPPPDLQVVTLNDRQREILRMVEAMGYDIATQRLLGLVPAGSSPPIGLQASEADEPAKKTSEPVRRKRSGGERVG